MIADHHRHSRDPRIVLRLDVDSLADHPGHHASILRRMPLTIIGDVK